MYALDFSPAHKDGLNAGFSECLDGLRAVQRFESELCNI